MASDARASSTRRVVVDTNVFELCELKTLAWRVFAARQASDNADNEQTAEDRDDLPVGERDAAATSLRNERTRSPREAFAAFAATITQSPTALTAWETRSDASGDSDEAAPLLWVFSVNSAQPLPTAAAAASVRVADEGTWSSDSGEEHSTDALPRRWLFTALRTWLATRLLARGEFRVERDLFCVNEARFVYRRPSLTRVDHFDVFLDEACATSGVALHVNLLPSGWLCVNVEMIHQDAAAATVGVEISGLASAWMRLMGLPRDNDHSMVDVWHTDDLLAARAVAETKYGDIYPRFRAFPRRKLRHHRAFDGDDDGAAHHDEGPSKGGKADGNGHDGDGDNDTGNDLDDDMRRNGVLSKKKRRKPGTEAIENDESNTPISPDTHVNSPDAGGPVVGMTFPRERQMLLHTDNDVHVFKRRRRKKNEPTTNFNGSTAAGSLSFGPLTSTNSSKSILPILGRARSVSQSSSASQRPETPKTPKTPAVSLAVSLVASLTQDEEREVLDSKPFKIHPLLQALDDYVEEEMAVHAMRNQKRIVDDHVAMVPNAPGFSPSVDEKKRTLIARLSSPKMDGDQLKSQLLSDRFKRYLTGYYPRDFKRNKRQQRRERDRKILLDYDESKLLEYAASAGRDQVATGQSVRDQELTIGIQLAALEALVPWRLNGKASSRWTPYASSSQRAADECDMLALIHHMTPHLIELQSVIKEKSESDITSDDEAGEVHDPWLTLERYCTKTSLTRIDGANEEMRSKAIDSLPRLCVATVESALHVEIPSISEYMLRSFQPVAAPKPVDYAIVCPHSPSQWLGTLTLSYVSMFRSTYAQSAMGDLAALDLSSVESGATVHVDAPNATMLVECTTSSDDAFATYRAAGEMLRPLLSQGIKRKQAFSRSPVANVVYLVAPFRRTDIKHKLWLLGAFGRGLFGEHTMGEEDDDWTKTVTLELLFLEDLINVGVAADPFVLLPAAMALYDRVFERVTLKPIANGDAASNSRCICERLYHLADPQLSTEETSTDETTCAFVHAGYAISSDEKWLLASFSDALGAVLETRTIAITHGDMASALLWFVELALEFVALMGEKSTLAIAQLVPSSSSMAVEADAWRELADQDAFHLLTRRFESVVSKIVVTQTTFVEKESVQVRSPTATIVKVSDHEGVMVIQPDGPAALQERSRVANNKWLRSIDRPLQHTTVLRVRLVHSIEVSDAPVISRDDLELMLTEWSSLSYLTTHPITLQRQSPLPLHLAAVDELHSELDLLALQLVTDPLVCRR